MICLSVPLTPSPLPSRFLKKPQNQILLSFRLSCPSATAVSVKDGLLCFSRQPFCNPISLSINNNERVLVPVSKRSVRGFCFKDSSLSDQDDQDLGTLPEGMVVTSVPGMSKDEIKVAPSQEAAVGRYIDEELHGQRLLDSESDSEFMDEDQDEYEDDYLMSDDDMGSHCNWILFYDVQLDFKTSTREEIVNMYLNRLTRAWGSEEEARRMIVTVLLDNMFAVKVNRLRKCHSKILEDPSVDVCREHEIRTSRATQLPLDRALLPPDPNEKANKKLLDDRRREMNRKIDILRLEGERRHEMKRKMNILRLNEAFQSYLSYLKEKPSTK